MDKQLASLIEINPEIMLGKSVIKGTRITVELILQNLASGASIDDILVSYPHINPEQFTAAIEYVFERLHPQ